MGPAYSEAVVKGTGNFRGQTQYLSELYIFLTVMAQVAKILKR